MIGDFDIASGVLTALDAAIKAGGTVGSAFIAADATKAAAKDQLKGQIAEILAQERVAEANAQASTDQGSQLASVARTGVVVAGALGVLWLLFGRPHRA